jgi:hypothetical protein
MAAIRIYGSKSSDAPLSCELFLVGNQLGQDPVLMPPANMALIRAHSGPRSPIGAGARGAV